MEMLTKRSKMFSTANSFVAEESMFIAAVLDLMVVMKYNKDSVFAAVPKIAVRILKTSNICFIVGSSIFWIGVGVVDIFHRVLLEHLLRFLIQNFQIIHNIEAQLKYTYKGRSL